MSVIIRLQNLPWSANSLDIRHYFRGLSIPEGGVHIVGGEMGDAFIAFSTDEDARQAMMLAGGKIKEVQISLMLSSRSEMQKIIKAARQASMSNSLAQLLAPQTIPQPLGAIQQQPQQPIQPQTIDQERRDSKGDKKDSIDLGLGGHEGNRRDRRDKSRSRSRDRGRKDRRDRDRDRDRDRRRKTRSRSRSRDRDRRRRRSRSRSRGRDNYNRERDRKDVKEDPKKEKEVPGTIEASTNLPNLDILNPNTWNVMQKSALAPNALLTNFELLRNLANQKGPLIPGGPNALLSTPINLDANEGSPGFGDNANRGNDFGNRGKGNPRFKGFEDSNSQDSTTFGGDGRFDRNRGPKPFQNFGPGFPMRNGSEPLINNRFGNFGRPENGFMARGVGANRPNQTRGLLDFPVTLPQRDDRNSNRQERFSNRDDRVDEFGRSIQLRNRKNASAEEGFNEDSNKFQGNQGNFPGFPNRFGPNQQNVRPPPLLRGRDSWPQSGGRGFRGSFDDSSRGGFRSKGRGEPFGKYNDDSDRGLEKDCCVEIRNLLPQVAYGEVRRPFSNLKLVIKEIKFFDYGTNDKKCRLRFLNNEHKKRAFAVISKILIDSKQVQLIDINDSDFDECVDEGVRRPDAKFSDDEDDSGLTSKDCYLQVKDVPLNVDEINIANLFPNMVLDKIIFKVSGDGKSKNAYVKFQKSVDAKVALGTPKRSIGDSDVFLSPLSQYAFNDVLHQSEKEQPGLDPMDIGESEEKEPEEGNAETTCILMKNLPIEANDRDICDFFSDIGLVPNKIHLMLDSSGQPCGDAFCEFSDYSQVERACTKNSAPLGKNNVIVNKIPRTEMLEALGVATRKETNATSPNKPPSLMESFGRPQCVLALENVPFRATTQDIINFFGWSYKLTENDVLRRYNERGQPTGDGKICLRTPEDALRALRFLNNRTLLGRAIRMKLI